MIRCACPQYEIDDLMPEVLRVADAGRFLDFFEFFVQRSMVEVFAGLRISEILVLYPEVGVGDVAVEYVLTVLGIGFEIGGLDLLSDELDIPGAQEFLEEIHVFVAYVCGELLLFNLFFKHIQQVYRIRGNFRCVEVKDFGKNLERKTRRQSIHTFVDAGIVPVFLN